MPYLLVFLCCDLTFVGLDLSFSPSLGIFLLNNHSKDPVLGTVIIAMQGPLQPLTHHQRVQT